MSFKSTILAAAAAVSLATMSFAGDAITVHDPYARSSTAKSTSGAIFMILANQGAQDDRLIDVRSDVAKKVELHTHVENGDGVMQMMQVKEGFAIPAGGEHMLKRGGDHVMLMGLTQPLKQGEIISLTLTFEKAGDVTIEVPVDLTRKPGEHMKGMTHKTDG